MYIRLMNATPPRPRRACSAAFRTVSVIWPLVMITVTPRAMPMISATPSRSRAPSTKVRELAFAPSAPARPIRIEKAGTTRSSPGTTRTGSG